MITSRYLVVTLVLAAVGCAPSDSEQVISQAALPVVRGSQLSSFVKESELPVLVEFGVDYQCERCAQMRKGIVEFGEKLEGRAKVVRVDFNANAAMVAELGGTICPTYVLFQDGSPVFTESFPISVDMLESRLESVIDDSSET